MERFGKFELLEKIGEGGMAEVFLAKPSDASFSKLVAVKRLLPQLKDDYSFLEMFRREGSIAMRFRHPSIIAVYEMGAIEGQPYISMEYFPGKPVARIMSRLRDSGQTLALLDKITIVKRIAEALHYIHEFADYGDASQIIHRDISPHNVMIGFNGVTKLIDFGIAKDINQETTQSRMIKGKVAYMSPEQTRGDVLTKQTDVFSLGIVFWELLAKKKLFTGKTIQEVSAKVKECRVPSLSDMDPNIPPEINRICLKMVTEQLHMRYLTAGEVASDLNDFLRVASAESREKSIARTMEKLFPEELAELRDQLRLHEGTQDGISASSGGGPSAQAYTTAKIRSVKRRRIRKIKDSNLPALLAIGAAAFMLWKISPRLKAIAKNWLPAPAPIAQTQAPVPAAAVAPVERKPAANPWAFVTVTAGPKATIWLNGVISGQGSVTAMQVPSEQPLTVKVWQKGWKKAKVRTFTPLPGSQNFIDVAR